MPSAARTTRFFAITLAVTWGLQLPGVLAQRGLLPGPLHAYLPFAALGIFGPLIAAIGLSAREGGSAAVKTLFVRLLRWRMQPLLYVLALFVPGALLSGVLALLNAAGRTAAVAYLPGWGGVGAALVISIAEEVGWRGYALPRLIQRWGAFAGGALLGVFWYLWHIPMFVGQGVPLNLVLVLLLYFIGASLLMTWLHLKSAGSLLIAVLAHWGAHLNNSHRALPAELIPLVVHSIIYAALGLAVMAGTLPRGRKQTAAKEPRRFNINFPWAQQTPASPEHFAACRSPLAPRRA